MPAVNPPTNAQLQTLFAQTLGSLRPSDIGQVIDALRRVSWNRGGVNTDQPTLGAIFPVGGPNP